VAGKSGKLPYWDVRKPSAADNGPILGYYYYYYYYYYYPAPR